MSEETRTSRRRQKACGSLLLSKETRGAPCSPYFGLPDCKEKIVDPRFRYITTSQLLGSAFAEAANTPARQLPLI